MTPLAIPRHNVNLSPAELRLLTGWLLGRATPGGSRRAFERAFADHTGVLHAYGVDSGRMALALVLRALDLPAGARVVLPAYAFHTLPAVVEALGFEPVFAPVTLDRLSLDPRGLAPHLDDAACVVLVHPFGQPGEVDVVARMCADAGVPLVEDASQSTGASLGGRAVGSFGAAGVFSLVSGKNLQTFGGGLITTDDDRLAGRLEDLLADAEETPRAALRDAVRQGLSRWGLASRLGFGGIVYPALRLLDRWAPARLDGLAQEERRRFDPERPPRRLAELQGALGLLELEVLPTRNARRLANARRLRRGLEDRPGLHVPRAVEDAVETYNAFPVAVSDARALSRALLRRGVDSRRDYMEWFGERRDFDHEILYLPNHPGLSAPDVDRLIDAVRAVTTPGDGARARG